MAFPDGKSRQEYVDSCRLRYDVTTGEDIGRENCVGIRGRKLRVVDENIDDDIWLGWVYRFFEEEIRMDQSFVQDLLHELFDDTYRVVDTEVAKNEGLGRAKAARNDEFYTQRVDIENELGHYAEHFRDKVVYCNCDDPVTSEFWRFFMRVFRSWGLNRLVATHYEPDAQNFSYSLEISDDTNGDGRIDMNDEPVITRLPCNGDFRSAACIELLQQADIVVTNPPFSLFREYVGQLMEYDKKFLIIGSLNAITYKEIFPLIKEDKIWLGYGFNNGNAYFRLPDGADISGFAAGVYNPETHCVKFRNCCWFTNLDIARRHEPMDLRGNYYYENEDKYPRYVNYDAINVDRTNDIPSDYDGVMGVPISFMTEYCPEQFEIIGFGTGDSAKALGVKKNYRGRTDLEICVNGVSKCPYQRILIRRR